MKIHEFQAKELLRQYRVPVPEGGVARTVEEAEAVARDLGGAVVVKAQIHAGGRGKGGGIKVAADAAAAARVAGDILGMQLVTHQTGPEGQTVKQVLVEAASDIDNEFYLGITLDRARSRLVVMASSEGGVEIEEVAATSPEKILKETVEPGAGLRPFQASRLAFGLGFTGRQVRQAAGFILSLFDAFQAADCALAEINPLVTTKGGDLLALDAKINLDDDSMFRHTDLIEYRDISQEDPLEAQASDLDIAYVNLDGDVGCLVNGAGLAMATLDVTTAAGAAPANFLDVGGGATPEKVASAVKIILSDPKVRRVLINIFGGILRCDIAGEGIVMAYKETGSTIPLVVRMLGTNVVEGKEILGASALPVVFADTLTEAANAIKQLNS